MAIHIEIKDCTEMHVKFVYSQERLNKIKSIPNRRWDSINKIWIIKNDIEALQMLHEVFYDEEVYIDGKIINTKEDILQQISSLRLNTINYANLPCIKALSDYLKLKGYSLKTRKSYTAHARRLIEYYKKTPETISEEELRGYLLYLIDEKGASSSYINQIISSVKLLYQNILKKPQLILDIPRPKKERKLPTVLSEEEVCKILESLRNLKHRAILYILYSAGLRISEVVRLKPENLDIDRMLIHVVQAKGKKDRYTMLSSYAYESVKLYRDIYKPEVWLFPGFKNKGHISERTVEKIFEQAASKTDIVKHATPHTFRHYVESYIMWSST